MAMHPLSGGKYIWRIRHELMATNAAAIVQSGDDVKTLAEVLVVIEGIFEGHRPTAWGFQTGTTSASWDDGKRTNNGKNQYRDSSPSASLGSEYDR